MNKYLTSLMLCGTLLLAVASSSFATGITTTMIAPASQIAIAADNVALTRAVRLDHPAVAANVARSATPAAALPQAGDQLIYHFFDNAVYTVTVSKVSAVYGNSHLIEGLCHGAGPSRYQAVLSDSGVRHEIHDFARARLYQATGDRFGVQEIREYDDTLRLPKYDLSVPATCSADTPTTTAVPLPAAASIKGVTVDIMILFDTGAKTWADNRGGMATIANSAVARLNTALNNSGIACSFRLVHTAAVSYTTCGNLYNDLITLNSSSTVLGTSTAIARNDYGADIICMLVDTGSAYGTVGMGNYPLSLSGNPDAVFSVCSIRSVNISHTMTHEVGHNLGGDHNIYQQYEPGPSVLFPYAAGWFFIGNDNVRYHTIMSYDTDIYNRYYTECDYFSTPLKTFQGVAVGDAAEGDNARAINIMAPIVANYRKAVLPTVADPKFSPADNTLFRNTLSVTISTTTADTAIFYTVNGSSPTQSSTRYNGPITLTKTTTIRARAYKEGLSDSAVTSATYTKATEYLVSFDSQGGTSPSTESTTVARYFPYGALPTTQRTGYTFAGWYTAPNASGSAITATTIATLATAHTLYAGWTPKTYRITFNSNGGSAVSPGSKQVTFNATYGDLPRPSRTGHIFSGWFAATDASTPIVTGDSIVTTPNNHTLYALWEECDTTTLFCPPEIGSELYSPGSYDGLFYAASPFNNTNATTVYGTLNLKLSKLEGKFTAKAMLQSGNVSFRGTLWDYQDTNNTCTVKLTARSGEVLQLNLRQNRIWGTLQGGKAGTTPLTLEGARNIFIDRSNTSATQTLAQYRGTYALSLPPHQIYSHSTTIDAAPQGHGYTTLTVGTRGTAKFAGVMADGTRLTRSARLVLFTDCNEIAAVPLFAPLYAKRGYISGLLWINPQATVTTECTNDWFVRWEKPSRGPDGFSLLLNVCGGFYTPPTATQYQLDALGNHPYWIDAEAIPPVAVPSSLTITADGNKLTLPRGQRPKKTTVDGVVSYLYDPENPASVTLKYLPRSGIFRGNFTLSYDSSTTGRFQHNTLRATYAGIFAPNRAPAFADLPHGLGHWLISDNSPTATPYRLKRSYQLLLTAE
ncbi:MAG: hypothetical protein GX230_03025 [Lentisphaerae bacterium]|nr:hypothetical protein [Lentisphaerota bacterium]